MDILSVHECTGGVHKFTVKIMIRNMQKTSKTHLIIMSHLPLC